MIKNYPIKLSFSRDKHFHRVSWHLGFISMESSMNQILSLSKATFVALVTSSKIRDCRSLLEEKISSQFQKYLDRSF